MGSRESWNRCINGTATRRAAVQSFQGLWKGRNVAPPAFGINAKALKWTNFKSTICASPMGWLKHKRRRLPRWSGGA